MRLYPLIIAAVAFATPAVAEMAPVDTIKALYQTYIDSQPGGALDKSVDILDPAIYSKRVDTLLAKLTKACKGVDGICGPDFDFFVDGQDYEIKKLVVKLLKGDAQKAFVEARFTNFKSPRSITFAMVNEGGTWVIDGLAAAKIGEAGGYQLDDVLKPNL